MPIIGDIKLLIKNRVRMFLIKSSSSGWNKEKRNKENGIKVVLRKKAKHFLYNLIDIFPVIVYLPSQLVNFYISIVKIKLVPSIKTENKIDMKTFPVSSLSFSALLKRVIAAKLTKRTINEIKLLMKILKYLLFEVI